MSGPVSLIRYNLVVVYIYIYSPSVEEEGECVCVVVHIRKTQLGFFFFFLSSIFWRFFLNVPIKTVRTERCGIDRLRPSLLFGFSSSLRTRWFHYITNPSSWNRWIANAAPAPLIDGWRVRFNCVGTDEIVLLFFKPPKKPRPLRYFHLLLSIECNLFIIFLRFLFWNNLNGGGSSSASAGRRCCRPHRTAHTTPVTYYRLLLLSLCVTSVFLLCQV